VEYLSRLPSLEPLERTQKEDIQTTTTKIGLGLEGNPSQCARIYQSDILVK
jgi:hypothetical protein